MQVSPAALKALAVSKAEETLERLTSLEERIAGVHLMPVSAGGYRLCSDVLVRAGRL